MAEVKVGGRYYFQTHAYHHYIAEVETVYGPGRYALKNVSKIHSSNRSWTLFFREGIGSGTETRYDSVPDKPYVTAFDVTEWPHELPRKRT